MGIGLGSLFEACRDARFGIAEPQLQANKLIIFYRATWAVFPYTLLVLCWHGILIRAGRIFTLVKEKKTLAVRYVTKPFQGRIISMYIFMLYMKTKET